MITALNQRHLPFEWRRILKNSSSFNTNLCREKAFLRLFFDSPNRVNFRNAVFNEFAVIRFKLLNQTVMKSYFKHKFQHNRTIGRISSSLRQTHLDKWASLREILFTLTSNLLSADAEIDTLLREVLGKTLSSQITTILVNFLGESIVFCVLYILWRGGWQSMETNDNGGRIRFTNMRRARTRNKIFKHEKSDLQSEK